MDHSKNPQVLNGYVPMYHQTLVLFGTLVGMNNTTFVPQGQFLVKFQLCFFHFSVLSFLLIQKNTLTILGIVCFYKHYT